MTRKPKEDEPIVNIRKGTVTISHAKWLELETKATAWDRFIKFVSDEGYRPR